MALCKTVLGVGQDACHAFSPVRLALCKDTENTFQCKIYSCFIFIF